ncbi:hypothetical protein Back2_18090 [Nocardioides baekrokdamisoli]|uniref:Uncharacterized protein n=2 Tax=Nocardioides baekrokdamisoli TaxID=1804624 RepID=A0A3G9IH45_9ACTN|nr:hypothetical protein Back2_18090 [Nocardioides baekrokdamisoli]
MPQLTVRFLGREIVHLNLGSSTSAEDGHSDVVTSLVTFGFHADDLPDGHRRGW